MSVKWTFTDETENPAVVSTFTLNPSEVEHKKGGYLTNEVVTTAGRRILQRGRTTPETMSISGTFFEQADYYMFREMSEKRYQVKLTDDLAREFWVLIEKWNPNRESTRFGGYTGASSSRLDWRMTYSINMTILDWSANAIF